jgi:4-aminobutyrate aminotransferase/(S)-3-amino-2-methylpropionate transaminase
MNSVPATNTSQSPTNADWQARKLAAIARGQGNAAAVYVERARNAELWDVEGRRYIDFATGIAVCNTGHSHPRVVEAVKEQVGRFSHTCVMITPYDSAVRLAEELNARAPGDTPKKSIFVSTGAEAVENSIKIARAHTRRRGVIAFTGGFHGRTLLAMGLTGKITPYKNLFGPFPGDVYHVPFPVAYHGIRVADSLRALNVLFKADIAPEDVAAIIVEPVQGEGGFYVAPDEFLQALRKLCDEHGIVLIADEIQTGFGRTGRFFACEYAGIEPDVMTVAKGIAGGYPLAAVVGKADIMDAPLPGGLGGTYAGSPVGCAAALAVLEVMDEDGLVERSLEIGARVGKRLKALQAKYPDTIGDVRASRGAMLAFELVEGGDPEKPAADLTKALVAKARENGLVLLSCGVNGNVIRLLPALTIEDEILDEGLGVLEESVDALLGGR